MILYPTPQIQELRTDETVHSELPIQRARGLEQIFTGGADHFTQRHEESLKDPRFIREGYVMSITPTGIQIYAPSDAGFYYGTHKADRMMKLSQDGFNTGTVIDYPSFQARFMLEAFWGMPWMMHQRLDCLKVCSEFGYNFFAYGPEDYNYRADWRRPLDERLETKLKTIIDHCHDHHIKFIYKLIPVQMYLDREKDPERAERDYQAMRNHARQVLALGADGIEFAFDDTDDLMGAFQRSDKAAAERQAAAANMLYHDIGDDKFMCFVPVLYYGCQFSEKKEEYLRTLQERLAPGISVGWTGPLVRSSSISEQEALQRLALIGEGRQTVCAINMPNADEGNKKRIVMTGPIMGLDPNLHDHLAGIGFAFAESPYTSLLTGLTGAAYAWNPQAYNPVDSINRVCSILNPNLIGFVMLNPESYMNLDGTHPTIAALRRNQHKTGIRRLSDLSEHETARLRKLFAEMSRLEDYVEAGIQHSMYPDIAVRIHEGLQPWYDQARRVGEMGLLVVDGNMNQYYSRLARFAGAVKVNGGYRLCKTELENWLFKEMGFPSSLIARRRMRPIFDFFERITRGRHRTDIRKPPFAHS